MAEERFDRNFDLFLVLRSDKSKCGCQIKSKKVPMIILDPGWGTNGLYIGLGISVGIGKSGSR
jgi:hypothetical protein